MNRVDESAVKIAEKVNAMSAHLTDEEAYELIARLIARLEKARTRLYSQMIKRSKRK